MIHLKSIRKPFWALVLLSFTLAACALASLTPLDRPRLTQPASATSAEQFLVDSSNPHIASADSAVIWTRSGEDCQTARINDQGIIFGSCGAQLISREIASGMLADDFDYFLKTYAPFRADTLAGKIVFKGQGQQEASSVEQRMIAEWARLVYLDAAGERGGAAYGVSFSWHASGGATGLCQDMTVYSTGEIDAITCEAAKPGRINHFRISPQRLEQVYAWADSLKSFELHQASSAGTNALKVRVSFSGHGPRDATESEKQAILDFAAELYRDLRRQ